MEKIARKRVNNLIQVKIQEQQRIVNKENRDRYVATQCLYHILAKKNKSVKIVNTPTLCPVDLKCTSYTYTNKSIAFNVEIKERNKGKETLENYPYAELRVDKLDRMYKETARGTRLYYMVLLNREKMYLFDLDNLDYDKLNIYNWYIKDTEMSDNSSYSVYPTYQIPYSAATVTLDISYFFDDYEKIKEDNK